MGHLRVVWGILAEGGAIITDLDHDGETVWKNLKVKSRRRRAIFTTPGHGTARRRPA